MKDSGTTDIHAGRIRNLAELGIEVKPDQSQGS